MKTRSCELNLIHPNQTYSCHSSWNWSTKSLSSPSNGFYPPLPFTLQFVFVKSLLACLIYLTSLSEDYLLFGFILSFILIHTTYLLIVFVLSLHCILDYGLPSVVYLPLHINRIISTVCLQSHRVLNTFIKITYSPPLVDN